MMNLSGFVVLMIFLLDVVVGWALREIRMSGSAKITLLRGTAPSQSNFRPIVNKTVVRTLTLKCQSGAIWNFREGSAPQPPGSQPIPGGDSLAGLNPKGKIQN